MSRRAPALTLDTLADAEAILAAVSDALDGLTTDALDAMPTTAAPARARVVEAMRDVAADLDQTHARLRDAVRAWQAH